MTVRRTAWIPILLACCAAAASAYTFERKYQAGEVDEYEIVLEPAGVDSELVAVTEHRTIVEKGVGREQIRFLRASESVVGDISDRFANARLTLSLDAAAQALSSWSGANVIATQLVDALQMFYIAQHPGAGAGRVRAPGESYQSAELFEEDWSQRPNTLAGMRRSVIQIKMTGESGEQADYHVRFSAPMSAGLSPPQPWMRASVCPDSDNSFYSVVLETANTLRVSWGCEDTTIWSEIEKKSGKVLRAKMATRILYQERFCKDEALTDCGAIESGASLLDARLLLRRTDPPLPADRLMTNARDGLEYVKIGPGSFKMGCVESDPDCYPREKPAHVVTISQELWMGRTEVPVAAFERFLTATGGAMPAEPGSGQMPGYNDGWSKKDHPMVKVTWDEAQAYCAWAGGRLPTEAEWEYAARGGLAGVRYPWGDERSHEQANYWRSGGRDQWKYTSPVASFPANGYGLYDMAGNVYEWTADWYDANYYGRSPDADPQGPANGRRRVARGGGGFINPKVLRISARLSGDPSVRNVGVGFRCALPTESDLALRQRLQRLLSETSKFFQ